MKREYAKPQIMFEDFTLSTNIAGDCAHRTFLPSNNTCGMDFSGLIVFMWDMQGCTDIKVEEGGSWDGICYHTPTENSDLFNS